MWNTIHICIHVWNSTYMWNIRRSIGWNLIYGILNGNQYGILYCRTNMWYMYIYLWKIRKRVYIHTYWILLRLNRNSDRYSSVCSYTKNNREQWLIVVNAVHREIEEKWVTMGMWWDLPRNKVLYWRYDGDVIDDIW